MSVHLLIFACASLLIFVICRVYSLQRSKHFLKRYHPAKTMIVLGSGGHTTEMMAIVRELKQDWYRPRTYVLAASDSNSESKIDDVEPNRDAIEILRISRSRSVHQSYISSVFTTIRSAMDSVPLVYKNRPELILCNGPGTCVPICVVAFLFKIFYINVSCRIVFVESFCRVRTVSLTGKILKWIVDLFVVQWPQLQEYSANLQYVGRIM